MSKTSDLRSRIMRESETTACGHRRDPEIPSGAEALTRALHPVRPDLRRKSPLRRSRDAARSTRHRSGWTLRALWRCPIPSTPSCVGADAMGVAPDALCPAIAAAFVRAREVGLDLHAVAERLNPWETP